VADRCADVGNIEENRKNDNKTNNNDNTVIADYDDDRSVARGDIEKLRTAAVQRTITIYPVVDGRSSNNRRR